jgi:hypothetical protein
VLAILCWGASRIPRDTSSLTHVRFWIDNTSAVSWCNGLHSRNPYTQELNRVIGAVEAWWRLRVSAAHLPGSANVLADLGSRAWDGERLARWRELTSSWTQVHVPQNLRKIYSSTCSPYSTGPSQTPLGGNTGSRGDSGTSSAPISDSPSGCWLTDRTSNRYEMAHFAVYCWTGRLRSGRSSANSIRSKLSHIKWYHRT